MQGWILLGLLVALTYTLATLVEVLKVPEGAVFQSGSKTTWVVVILLTGVIGAFFYQVAGKPKAPAGKPKAVEGKYGLGSELLLPGPHVMKDTYPRAGRPFACDSCSFRSLNITQAYEHTGAARAAKKQAAREAKKQVGTALGVEQSVAPATSVVDDPPAPELAVASDFKTCPDCAEQVRVAARKCRFCGYMFDLESSPAASG